jgi:hypothetical protein
MIDSHTGEAQVNAQKLNYRKAFAGGYNQN